MQIHLDSLYQILDQTNLEIEHTKNESHNSNREVRELMANSLDISRHIKQTAREYQILSDSLQLNREKLNILYAGIIDSLEDQINKTRSAQQKAELQIQITELTEIRLTCLPSVLQLSFDWDRIKNLPKLDSSQTFENCIYIDYVQGALNEIDSNIHILEQSHHELTAWRKLQQKKFAFLEDIELERNLNYTPLYQNKTSDQVYADDTHNDPSTTEVGGFFDKNAHSLRLLVNQLDIQTSYPMQQTAEILKKSSGEHIDPEEYLLLITQTILLLEQYRARIQQKLP